MERQTRQNSMNNVCQTFKIKGTFSIAQRSHERLNERFLSNVYDQGTVLDCATFTRTFKRTFLVKRVRPRERSRLHSVHANV